MTPIGLGFRATRGGSVVVGVAAGDGEPRVVLSKFLATATEGDRLALEPYHVAFETVRAANGGALAEAAAAVAEGRKRQEHLAVTGLTDIVRQLRAGGREPTVAALLVNRAGWVTDLLAYSLAFAEHPPVAEGLAVREALRHAIRGAGLELAEMDKKSLPGLARDVLSIEAGPLELRLKALGATAGKPWRQEQKLACLAAWVALTGRGRERPGRVNRPGQPGESAQ